MERDTLSAAQPSGAPSEDPRREIAALKREVSARDEFIATVAHELRNPLNPLIFQTRILLDKLAAAEPEGGGIDRDWTLAQVRRFEQQLQRLLVTLDRLLDVSRLSSGRIDLNLELVNLGTVMREVIAAFEGELTAARCDVRLRDEGGACGQWDRLRVEQVCRNLLSNAIRFGAGRPIDIAIRADNRFAVLEVRDYGIGIEREHQQRIFERFERVRGARRSGGFGVGLWVTRLICTALGGSVNVESEIGHGARFTVVLPRQQSDDVGRSQRQ
jgi:signal transduction histidine kinase